MKDSGIEWVGSIPDNWKSDRVKYHFRNKKKIAGANADKYERLALTLKGVIKRSKDDDEGLQPEKFDGYQILKKDELVFKLIDLQNISTSRVGLSPYEGLVSPAYIIISSDGSIDPMFAEKYFLSMWQREIFNALGDSGVRSSLTAYDLLNLKIAYPPLDEQKRIARFLDEKNAKITELSDSIQNQIDILEKYKKSIISEVVLKGVQAHTLKKCDSEWLDEIPENWEMIPFRYVLCERTEKNNPVKTDERLSLSIDVGITLYADKTTNLDRYKEDVSQYKLAYPGDLVMNSMNVIVGAVGVSKWFGCVSPAYYTYYDNEPDHVTARYCDYIFKTPVMRSMLYRLGKGILAIERGEGRINTCRLKVPREDLRKIRIPVPSLEEQRDIVAFLDKKCSDIDAVIDQKKQQLDTLESYKKSITYEYITGKREVPA